MTPDGDLRWVASKGVDVVVRPLDAHLHVLKAQVDTCRLGPHVPRGAVGVAGSATAGVKATECCKVGAGKEAEDVEAVIDRDDDDGLVVLHSFFDEAGGIVVRPGSRLKSSSMDEKEHR